jgi:hypothetical protein
MNAFEKFKEHFFSCFEGHSPGHEMHLSAVHILTFASKAGISVDSARESMADFAREELITLGSWDAKLWRVRDWTDWLPDVNAMFFNSDDQNCVRVKLRCRGEEYLLSIHKHKIGFVV